MEPESWGGRLLSETKVNAQVEAVPAEDLTESFLARLSVLALSLSWLSLLQKVLGSRISLNCAGL